MIKVLSKDEKEKMNYLENIFPEVLSTGFVDKDFKSNPFTHYIYIENNGKIIGFLNYTIIYDRMEVININVCHFEENKHNGSKMIEYIISEAKRYNLKNITLEVKETNKKAIHLYEKHGFIKKAKRKNYYQNIDGILMEKEMIE